MSAANGIVSTDAVDTWPYWRAKSTKRVHRVTRVGLVWRGPSASYERPRPIIDLACMALWSPHISNVSALTGSRQGEPCPKCFPEAS